MEVGDFEDWELFFRKMRTGKERYRAEYAFNEIIALGYTCRYDDENKRITFDFKGHTVMFYPYKGWFTGKSVKDGRGLINLLKQIKQ